MDNQTSAKIEKTYLISVLLLMLVLPVVSIGIEAGREPLLHLIGKWFVFWAIGVRLFTAGIRQAVKPAFTAESIFHLKNPESFILVRELGYANICLGLIGIVSLFSPQWRMASACSGGLFLGIAGITHVIKRPVSPNEWLAMISDLFIALIMLVYLLV